MLKKLYLAKKLQAYYVRGTNWILYCILYVVPGKVIIIYKSRSEVSLLEQPTIECVFLAYLKLIFKF